MRRHALSCLLTTTFLLATTTTPVGAQDGAYIVEPWQGGYSDVKIQPGDQKIVVAGSMYVDPVTSTEQRMTIARYDSLGNRDNTYGIGGPSIPPLSGVSAPALGPDTESGYGLALQPDGKAVVSGLGSFAGAAFAVARFQTNGMLDDGFGSGGWSILDVGAFAFNPAYGVGLQSTGKVVLAGFPLRIGNSYYPAEVARFTAAGILDSGKGAFGQVVQGKAIGYSLNTFGLDHNAFFDLAIQPDDKLVAVGSGYTDPTSHRLIVARYTASGTLDKTFNGKGFVVFVPAGISEAGASAVALQSNGKIVAAGSCTGNDGGNDMLVARFNANGTLDTGFGGGSGYVQLDVDGTASVTVESAHAVVIQPDGKIVAAGSVSASGGASTILVVRLNANGTPDATFGGSGFKIGAPLPGTGYHSFEGSGVALQSNGSILVAGSDDCDSTDNSEFHPLLMRFDP
jgi:uncharacterized delta-60 repeat protein